MLGATGVQSESTAVVAYPLPLLGELSRLHLGQGLDRVTEGVRTWDQLSGTFAVGDALHQAFLARRGEQATVQITELTLPVVVACLPPGRVRGKPGTS